MNIKFGVGQFNNPAPLAYRKFTNWITIAFLPPTVTLLHAWGGISDTTLHRVDVLAIWIGAMLAGGRLGLGNGQKYVPSNKTMEERKD